MKAVFFAPDARLGEPFILPEDESTHLLRVLRMKAGEELVVADGEGNFFDATLVGTAGKKAQCLASKQWQDNQNQTYHLHLLVGITKTAERFEWMVEKAVELGIHRITPLLTERCERKKINVERLERIALAAMKQSQRAYLPVIDALTPLKQAWELHPDSGRFIAHCEEDKPRVELTSQLRAGTSVQIFIGPEGDFSPAEISAAKQAGCLPVALGPARLRTETAALFAAASVLHTNI